MDKSFRVAVEQGYFQEIAWIRAVDNTDPKLRFANDTHYLVRTVNLTEGKNAIEIFVTGERVGRVAYTG